MAAPVDVVFETLTTFGHWAALLGLPLRCPDGALALAPGLRYRLRLGAGPLAWETDGEVVAWQPPHFFVERRTRLPFARWEHHRRLTALSSTTTLVADRLLVAPRGLPAPPEALQPSPWKLALHLGLWAWHDRLGRYL